MDSPSLTIALALAAGMIAQSLAHHIRVPGIIVLLLLGVLLGPDAANLIRPETLGSGLFMLVGFAVAVILFEGGMNLRLQRLKREGRTIRLMITVGALITAVLGMITTKIFIGWDWRQAILFGALIPVTGPTVISPLLRRIRVKHSLATILEAEGILLDAIAAIVAAVALEVAISPTGLMFAKSGIVILLRLGFGSLLGAACGYLLAVVFRYRNLIPEGLENVFTLSIVLALYQISGAIMAESGIVAVTVAGLVVGNSKSFVQRELREFKEQLTVLLIGMLFILLAADVRLAEIRALGYGGVITVILLIFVIRPLSIFASTRQSDLDLKQKIFIAWIGPRGIVAAAVASLFAFELEHHGYNGGNLRAMVFLVIAVTVLLSGLSGGFLASLLKLRRPVDNGWLILGAHELAQSLGSLLQAGGHEVVCIDTNPKQCRQAEALGLKVIYADGMAEGTFIRAEIDTRIGVIGFTPNEEVNLLFAQKAKQVGKLSRLLVAISTTDVKTIRKLVEEFGGKIMGARPFDLEAWNVRLRRDTATIETHEYHGAKENDDDERILCGEDSISKVLPLVLIRNGKYQPVDNTIELRPRDRVAFVVNTRNEDQARAWLKDHNFKAVAKV